MRRESLIHKILRKLGFIKDIEDCDICAWDTKGGVSYENH